MNNVRQLHVLHPERRAALSKFAAEQASFWVDQAARQQGGAAALHMMVTGDHRIQTKMCAVEPEHAAVLLGELDRVRAQLCRYLADQAPELLDRVSAPGDQSVNVVALHR